VTEDPYELCGPLGVEEKSQAVEWLIKTYRGANPANVMIGKFSEYPRFNSLAAGVFPEGLSGSEADFKMVCECLSVTQRASTILEVIHRTELWDDKWEREDYVHRTLEAAGKSEQKAIIWAGDMEPVPEEKDNVPIRTLEADMINEFQKLHDIGYSHDKGLVKFNGCIWSHVNTLDWEADFAKYIKEKSLLTKDPGKFEETWNKISKLKSVKERLESNVIESNVAANGINTESGYFDLATLVERPALPADNLFIQARVDLKAKETTGAWDKFVKEILPNEDVREYVQRIMGSILTTDTLDQKVFLFVGKGANGKTLFVSAIAEILGDYGVTLPSDIFKPKKQDMSRERALFPLIGKRFVVIEEAPSALDENLVKQVTGGGSLYARQLFKEGFEFKSYAKLFFVSNEIPSLKDVSLAFKRRLSVIKFTESFVERADLDLRNKLWEDRRAVFTWLVRGYLSWMRKDVRLKVVPELVQRWSREVTDMGDVVQEFVDEMIHRDKDMYVFTRDLYPAYVAWIAPDKPLNRNTFWRHMYMKEFVQKQKKIGGINCTIVEGISLIENRRGF
jgi:P4 family phage/plasmid primase-like protien